MKKIFITGASGFIGRYALSSLIDSGYEIHAVSSQNQLNDDTVFWHKCNLLNSNTVSNIIHDIRPTHLLHLAWYTEHGKYWTSFDNYKWVEATLALVRTFRESGGERAVIAGTCAEYDWNYGYFTEGLTPLVPTTPYGICKQALQTLIASYSELSGLSCAWGRVFFLYGPHESSSRLVPSIIHSLISTGHAKCSHGNQIRDFMHVKDVASAFVAILESNLVGPVNVSTGDPVRIRYVADTIANILGQSGSVKFGAIDAPANDPPMILGNPARLKQDIGWHPEFTLSTGLEHTVQWWQSRSVRLPTSMESK